MIRLALVLMMLAAPVWGQGKCAPRDMIVIGLQGKFKEAPSARAMLNNDRAIFELWLSESGETFTLLATFPDGMSCIVAAGKNWQKIEPKIKGTAL